MESEKLLKCNSVINIKRLDWNNQKDISTDGNILKLHSGKGLIPPATYKHWSCKTPEQIYVAGDWDSIQRVMNLSINRVLYECNLQFD